MSIETVKIVQTGSPIRRHHTQRETLIGLGLNRIGRVAEVPNTRATWGMIAKVQHLVRVIDEELFEEHRLPGRHARGELPTTTLTLPWAAPTFVAVKGIVHEPAEKPTMSPESRDALLAAIAKARKWIEDLRFGRVATFAEIADREGLGERHVRLLAPLAFVAPCLVTAIADGTAPADLTVSGLAKALPCSWAQQKQRFTYETIYGIPPRAPRVLACFDVDQRYCPSGLPRRTIS
jgi:ribosomal protein L30